MILHVGNPSTFLGPLKKLMDSEFPQQHHKFWLMGGKDNHGIVEEPNVFIGNDRFFGMFKSYTKLASQMHSAQKVMLHGLFNTRVLVLLGLMPWLLPKCYWIIWGGDLYQYKAAKNGWRSRLKEFFRRLVIQRIGHLVTYIEGDVELARQWYGAKGTHHKCIMYLSNAVDPNLAVESRITSHHNCLNILLGNSSDPSNNHIEALERLRPLKDRDIKIYAPLSYGDRDHARKVIRLGQELFGEKFVPMMDFMPFEEYLKFLTSLDIAIFNHRRQQAMGNTITLLGLGKAVFMRTDVSQWELFKQEGITVFDVERNDFKPLTSETAVNNVQIVKQKFSRERLVEQYARIFDS